MVVLDDEGEQLIGEVDSILAKHFYQQGPCGPSRHCSAFFLFGISQGDVDLIVH